MSKFPEEPLEQENALSDSETPEVFAPQDVSAEEPQAEPSEEEPKEESSEEEPQEAPSEEESQASPSEEALPEG